MQDEISKRNFLKDLVERKWEIQTAAHEASHILNLIYILETPFGLIFWWKFQDLKIAIASIYKELKELKKKEGESKELKDKKDGGKNEKKKGCKIDNPECITLQTPKS